MDVLPLLCFLFARYLLKPSPRSLSLSACVVFLFFLGPFFPFLSISLFPFQLRTLLTFHSHRFFQFAISVSLGLSSDISLQIARFLLLTSCVMCIIQNIAKPPKNPTQKKAAIFAISHIILYGSIFWPFLCSLMKRKFVIWEYVRLFYSRRCILECIVHNEVYCFSQWRLTKGMV